MQKYRHLLEDLKPSHYQLDILLDPEKLNFKGEVQIVARAAGKKPEIILHQHKLEITEAAVNGELVESETNHETDTLTLKYQTKPAEDLDINIKFKGKITDAMNGIYPSRSNGKVIIGTQFESHHAREAFPCVDEPAAKATFQLSVTAPKQGTFLSNTLPLSAEETSLNKTVHFDKTPVMSTYLLAFVWGELEALTVTSKGGTEIQAWATPDKYQATEFALDVAKQSLEFYENYFGIKYPLRHCHHVALPDFAAGAMENWGCITYRESQFLVDESTPIALKKAVAITVAHEVAHQWFGNLVTMEWWTDLWLNEGFASWISVYAIDQIFPDWQIWDDFIVDDVLRAIELDSLRNTHAIEIDIGRPEEIRGIFDAISYNKGAAVIRMLNGYLGDEVFRQGLSLYMESHKYGNAKTADLWKSLEKVSSKPVEKMMSSWTKQAGFPLVTAQYEAKKLLLSQKRFTQLPNSDKTLWTVPLYDQDRNYLTEKSASFDIKKPAKLNLQQMGPYLVSYDNSWQKEINTQIKANQLEASDVTGYLYERFQLAREGSEHSSQALAAALTIKNNQNLTVWQTVAGEIGRIKKVMQDEQLDAKIHSFIDQLTEVQLKRLGFQEKQEESEREIELRSTIIGLSAAARNQETINWAKQQFEAADSFESLPANLRTLILSTAVKHGDDKQFEKVYQAYADTSNAQLKISYTAALTSTENETNIEKLLEDIKTSRIKLQEVGYWVAFLLRNRYSREQAWQWLKHNWQWIVDSFGRDIMSFAYFPIYAGKVVNNQEFLNDLESFFAKAHTDGIERQVAQAIEFATIQTRWREHDFPDLVDYFKDF